MEIPDTVDTYLKPLALSPVADETSLPPNLSRQLSSIINHFQNKRSNIVLFSGASTSAYNAAANLLSKLTSTDVYRIDLSAVASKYLGETEKHLLKVFEFVEKHHFILLFDEADSLFGKRTGVRDSHDRYANLEISYLLKRIEEYHGLVIITTNARDDLDDTLLRAAPWHINLSQPVLRRRLPWWQRLFNRLRKR